MPIFPQLPICAVLPDIARALTLRDRVLLQAPPGSGKTTVVPPYLLNFLPPSQGIIILEPRRLAARNAAGRMAELFGEPIGRTVGYHIRMERKISPATRILVVTEGILTNMLRDTPELPNTGLVIFDEFHERSIYADTGLALTLECIDTLRDASNPLKILIMSATLETAPLTTLLSDGLADVADIADNKRREFPPCPVITSKGISFPVETHYLPPLSSDALPHPAPRTARAVKLALQKNDGDILAFLPGTGDILTAAEILKSGSPPLPRHVLICPLYGDLPANRQDAALTPAPPGQRKVILATNIAESSLNIEGIRVVIDSGLERYACFDPALGMNKLLTRRISIASADQRRGRAGRFAPGICYRLWNKEDESGMRPFGRPEILDADLASVRLELALWGIPNPANLRWLDLPPADRWNEAADTLTDLGALNGSGRITEHGKSMAYIPVHPRLAHMLIAARERNMLRAGALLAAVLEDRIPLRTESADIRTQLTFLAKNPQHPLHAVAERLIRLILRQNNTSSSSKPPLPQKENLSECIENIGVLLAAAYPERLAGRRRTSPRGQYLTVSGRGAELAETDALAESPFLAVGTLNATGRNAKIFQAAPLCEEDVRALFGNLITHETVTGWDTRKECVIACTREKLRALTLNETLITDSAPDVTISAVLEGIRSLGLGCLPWTEELLSWRTRVLFLRCFFPDNWPDMRDETLYASVQTWLSPYLNGVTKKSQFSNIALAQSLHGLLDPMRYRELNETLERLAPASVTVPTGSRIHLSYPADLLTCTELPHIPQPPVLAVKLQELFGLTRHPTVAGGRVPVRIHLLSPAGRPIQITQDIAGFWQTSYAQVRSEMRGRYPKHPWPDDPLNAVPTKRTKPRTGT